MKKYKSGWKKEKCRREAEDTLKKSCSKIKKVTDFFHISESNIVETTSSNATALCSSSSDCIPEPEPIIKIVSWEQIYKPSHLMLLRMKRIG